jgi:hypothetical protein
MLGSPIRFLILNDFILHCVEGYLHEKFGFIDEIIWSKGATSILEL